MVSKGVGEVLAHSEVRTESSAADTVESLEDAISRILVSQLTMRKANHALVRGDIDLLRAMRFSEEHIEELLGRRQRGTPAFAESAFRSNIDLIRALRRRQADLVQAQAQQSRPLRHIASRRSPYVCEADNPRVVPFLAAFHPFVL